MRPYLIRVLGIPSGAPCPYAGQWVESFNHDAHDGRGGGTFTADPDRALAFASPEAAFRFWTRTSAARPVRPDGQPNRPLSALTIDVHPKP